MFEIVEDPVLIDLFFVVGFVDDGLVFVVELLGPGLLEFELRFDFVGPVGPLFFVGGLEIVVFGL